MANRYWSSVFAAAVCAGACTGYIEPGGSRGTDDGNPSLPGGGPGGPGTSGAGGGPQDPVTAPTAWRPGDELPPPGEAIPVDQKVPEPTDPGGVRLRRLNRVEYNNTVRDLLGTAMRPADEFPDDDVQYGFDTIGAALNTSPLHVEMYERAATALVDELFAEPADSPRRRRILLSCDVAADLACARQVLEGFAARAFRRPVTPAEVDRLVGIVEGAVTLGASQEAGVRLALSAVLMSPHFVYRVEIDPDPTSPAGHRLTDHELASRLSYFLWSTAPDDALRAAADAGTLQDDVELQRQVERMLDSEAASALVEHFAGQWLFTRSIDNYEPDYAAFPTFDDALRASMRQETELFFRSFLTGGQLLSAMVTAEYTFVDARLAAHYELPQPAAGFQQVSLAGTPRLGLLTQGSFLLVTSTPTRTSPVKRGKWVLDQLLCSPPPPPPPGVEGLEEGANAAGTLRERLERHRTDPVCASCHEQMDPIGLGLQNFDGIGAYRTTEAGEAIDATGKLPSGETFAGARELAALVAKDTRFDACMTQQFLTYAVGRGFDRPEDRAWISHLTQEARERGGTVRDLIVTIAASEVFRSRRAVPEESR